MILGKTTTPEFGWKAIGDSPLTGITRNPWNLDHTPGGSSAGAAAACAAGIGAPACRQRRRRLDPHPVLVQRHFRDQGDLRPGAGASALADGAPVECRADDAAVSRDAAAMLNVLSQPDHRDPYALPPDGRDYLDGIDERRARLARRLQPRSRLRQGGSRNRRSACAEAVRRFEELGASRRDGRRDLPVAARRAADPVVGRCRAGAGRFPVKSGMHCATPACSRWWRSASASAGADFVAADLARTALGRRMGEFHQPYDLLLTPMMPVTALPVGHDMQRARTSATGSTGRRSATPST